MAPAASAGRPILLRHGYPKWLHRVSVGAKRPLRERRCCCTIHIKPADIELLSEIARQRQQSLAELLSDTIEIFAAERRPLERCHVTQPDAFVRLDKRAARIPEE